MIFYVMGSLKVRIVGAMTVCARAGSIDRVNACVTIVVGACFKGSIAHFINMAM